MKYLKDVVKLKNPKYPIISYYELNDEHYMLRVIEFFEHGRVDTIIADAYMQEEPLPSIEEMNSEKYNESGYFVYVSQEEFENLWDKYAPK
jgi:hypothetical protein